MFLRTLILCLAFLPSLTRAQPLTINAQSYGARPGTDCTVTAQVAVDAMAARLKLVSPGVATKGIVYFPGDAKAYGLGRSIFVDADFVEIRGDGNSTRFQSYPGTAFPHFIFGVRRWAGTATAYAAYRPDLFGRLDATAVSAAGQRWGWRSGGDSCLMASASPLNAGGSMLDGSWGVDNWTKGQALTLEFALDGGGKISTGVQFGIGPTTDPRPFSIYTDAPDHFVVLIGTQAAPFGPVVSRRLGFMLPAGVGTRRIAVQIDLATARYGVFVDGRSVGLDFDQMGLAPSASLRFSENDYYPLLLGDGGGSRPSWSPTGVKFDLLGFGISRSLRYAWGVAGDPQRRLDGKPITDVYRYFTWNGDDPGHLASLAFTDPPASMTRQLTVQGGPGATKITSGALLLHAAMLGPGSVNIGQGLRDVQLMGGRLYGSNAAIGQVINFSMSGVRSRETYYGIGSLGFGAIYTLKLSDLDLDGSDSSLFLQSANAWVRDVIVNGGGRSTYRFEGCSIDLVNSMTSFSSTNPQSIVAIHTGDYGGQYTLKNIIADNEGTAYTRAPYYVEAHPYGQTTFRLTDSYLGTTGDASIPLFRLVAPNPLPSWWAPATFAVDHVDAENVAGKAAVDSSGLWRGELKNSPGISPLVKVPAGTVPGVVVVQPGAVGPPSPVGPAMAKP